ncbi:hypothetical protein KCP71_25360 [Salmonella enterica subsp. enterica]|nr:hypothetical protein KCP71_25360 [Salmonella enterica subsp. enterica]
MPRPVVKGRSGHHYHDLLVRGGITSLPPASPAISSLTIVCFHARCKLLANAPLVGAGGDYDIIVLPGD